MVPPAESF